MGNKLILLTARGDAGHSLDGPNWGRNYLDPYVMSLVGFLGVACTKTVAVEYDEFGGVSLADSLRVAEEDVRALARRVLVDTSA